MDESQKPNNTTINKENKTSERVLDPLMNGIKFDLDNLDPPIKKSPIALKKWLDYHIPWLIGPRIDSFCPSGGHRSSIITIRGNNFASNRLDNNVTIGAISLPVLRANTTELKVLVTKDVDTGPIKVSIGTLSAQSTQNFVIKTYPNGIIDDDGPPLFAIGEGDGQMGDVNPIGTVQVLVVICQALDKVPSNLSAVRTTVNNRWTDAQTFYTQASYSRTNVQYDIVSTAAQLDGNFTDFVDLSATVQNVISGQRNRIAAIAAQHARNEGRNLNNYHMLCCVVFTDSAFIRAWGGADTQNFSYDDGKPVGDPSHISINITLNNKINLLWINENADWGRFAHEFGHNIVSTPTHTGEGTATLGEDVYRSDLIDPSAATAHDFEMMGNHDRHPIFTGYHLEKLGYYNSNNIREIQWDRNPYRDDFEIIAHGLYEDTNPNRFHILKIKISNALSYYVEVRQRPGATTQIFDSNIPINMAPNQGGVIVTRVIADEMYNNQQTRFITLMHDNRVQIQNDTIEDPARALRITVLNDSVQTRPLVCRVRVEWAQTIADDPNGSFDLNVEPWNENWESPDVWIDRDPFGSFDNSLDGQGRPLGNGDRPWIEHINHFIGRVHVSGAMGANNVKVTFYAISPPGVGDNGNWAPINIQSIANIPVGDYREIFCNWVPVINRHTCLKIYVSQQLGEISGGNNSVQENVFDFQAAGSSTADPLFIRTAIRNPVDEPHAVYLSIHGIPKGWAAQIPNAWVWLDGKAEREIDVMIWPFENVNAYKFGKNKEGKLPEAAPLNIAGNIERTYNEELESSGMPGERFPGSRFYLIGGTLYRTEVRRKSSIRIQVEKGRHEGKQVDVFGMVDPAILDQQVILDLLFPDEKTHRAVYVKTNSAGRFNSTVDLLDDRGNLLAGLYRITAFIFHSTDLADAASNTIDIIR